MKTIKKIQRFSEKTIMKYFITFTSDFQDATLTEKEMILVKAKNWKSDTSFFMGISTVFILGALVIKSLILV